MAFLNETAAPAIYTYYRQNPDPALGPGSGDAAFFHFVSTQLPSPVPGLFMAAMLAAIMSTLSSGMNSMAAVWLKEIHQKFINRNLAPSAEVTVSKYATLLIGVFAVGLALALELSGQWLTQSVSEVGTIFYLIGAAILPAFLFAVLSSRANAKLIWGYTAFAFGEGVAMNLWYALSRSSEQAWRLDPAAGFGWAGKLDFCYGWFRRCGGGGPAGSPRCSACWGSAARRGCWSGISTARRWCGKCRWRAVSPSSCRFHFSELSQSCGSARNSRAKNIRG